MKKLLLALLTTLLVLTCASALADTLPDEIAELFDVPAWEGYEVPYSNEKSDRLAYIWLVHSDCGWGLQKKGD